MQLTTRERRARKICGLRLFHPDPWPTRALAEARRSWLAGSTARWGNLGGHWRVKLWTTFGQQQSCREPREIGDWRLDVEEPTSPCPCPPGSRPRPHPRFVLCYVVLSCPHPPAAFSATRLQPGGTVPAEASWSTEACAMVETGGRIVCATRSAMRVGKMLLLLASVLPMERRCWPCETSCKCVEAHGTFLRAVDRSFASTS